MSQASSVNVAAGAIESPVSPRLTGPSLLRTINFGHFEDYDNTVSGNVNIAAPATPFTLPIAPIVGALFVGIHVVVGPLELQITSVAGVDQKIKLSHGSRWMWQSDVATDAITALKFLGTGEITYAVAGSRIPIGC